MGEAGVVDGRVRRVGVEDGQLRRDGVKGGQGVAGVHGGAERGGWRWYAGG